MVMCILDTSIISGLLQFRIICQLAVLLCIKVQTWTDTKSKRKPAVLLHAIHCNYTIKHKVHAETSVSVSPWSGAIAVLLPARDCLTADVHVWCATRMSVFPWAKTALNVYKAMKPEWHGSKVLLLTFTLTGRLSSEQMPRVSNTSVCHDENVEVSTNPESVKVTKGPVCSAD